MTSAEMRGDSWTWKITGDPADGKAGRSPFCPEPPPFAEQIQYSPMDYLVGEDTLDYRILETDLANGVVTESDNLGRVTINISPNTSPTGNADNPVVDKDVSAIWPITSLMVDSPDLDSPSQRKTTTLIWRPG